MHKEAWEKIPTLLKLPSPTRSSPVSFTPPTPPASYSSERPPPILPIKCFVHFYSACSVKPFLFFSYFVLLFLVSLFALDKGLSSQRSSTFIKYRFKRILNNILRL